jgi:hypothetical protein
MYTRDHYTYYQPISYTDNGIDIQWGDVPEGMYDFQAFLTKDIAEAWLKNNGYEPGDFCIMEYQDDDIEEVTIIDENGENLDRIEDLDDDEIADRLIDTVIWNAGSEDNLHTCKQDDETQQEYEDRIYTWALDLVNDAITDIETENDYNFQSYAGTPDTEWYDKGRDIALREILRIMVDEPHPEYI